MEVASFMTCNKGYMGECGAGIWGDYDEVMNMDPEMTILQKNISAKLCTMSSSYIEQLH